MKIALPFLLPLVIAAASAADTAPAGAAIKGAVEKIVVHGKSLEGNLEGDSPDRDVFVYLPVSYAKNRNQRYPVLYFLHGYGVHAETYTDAMWVSDAADKTAAAGTSKEMIVVYPDSFTIYN